MAVSLSRAANTHPAFTMSLENFMSKDRRYSGIAFEVSMGAECIEMHLAGYPKCNCHMKVGLRDIVCKAKVVAFYPGLNATLRYPVTWAMVMAYDMMSLTGKIMAMYPTTYMWYAREYSRGHFKDEWSLYPSYMQLVSDCVCAMLDHMAHPGDKRKLVMF